ncbi:MAG: hypothetical protein GX637_08140 [Clostridiales bacterium]|nr:hypothetical protein [Clostridiales bacterium]
MKKAFLFLTVLAVLSGVLPPSLQAEALARVLPGRWMLYAGGGAETWDFHEDGTCVSAYTDVEGSEHSETHTWRVEAATEEDLKTLWAQPQVVLVIDGGERLGLHLTWAHIRETALIVAGGWITEEERARTAPLPLCISLTFGEGGGGYVRMKDQ